MTTPLQWNFHLALVFLAAVFVSNPTAIASAQPKETKSAEFSPGKSISHTTAAEMQIQALPLPDLLLEPPAIPGVKEAIARSDKSGMSTDAGNLLPNWGKVQHGAARRASTDTKLKLVQANTNNQPSPSVDTTPSIDSAPGPAAVSQASPTTSDQTPNSRESATTQEDTSPQSDRAQTSQPSDPAAGTDLRQQSQSPIGNVISLPFQNNTNFGVGQFDRTQNILNIQPVIPTSLGKNWLLISRIIIPIVYQPQLARGVGDEFGLGDINPEFFFSPRSSGKLTWGAGPVFLLPTATDDTLGADKWGIGPSAVVVYSSGNIVTGALANNIWSFAGDDDRPDVNQFLLQPFFNYNLPKGWFLVSAPIITANWEAEAGEEWTVPIGGGFGRLFTIGKQPVSASLQGYYNVVRPEDSTEWTIRAAFTLLYPR